MMPGKSVCDEGWTTEYPGYISAERSDEFHFRGECVCVDDDAEPSAVSNTLDIKESFSFKTRMPGTVKCRPTVAY